MGLEVEVSYWYTYRSNLDSLSGHVRQRAGSTPKRCFQVTFNLSDILQISPLFVITHQKRKRPSRALDRLT